MGHRSRSCPNPARSRLLRRWSRTTDKQCGRRRAQQLQTAAEEVMVIYLRKVGVSSSVRRVVRSIPEQNPGHESGTHLAHQTKEGCKHTVDSEGKSNQLHDHKHYCVTRRCFCGRVGTTPRLVCGRSAACVVVTVKMMNQPTTDASVLTVTASIPKFEHTS